MGCVVSHKQVGAISIAQTPRDGKENLVEDKPQHRPDEKRSSKSFQENEKFDFNREEYSVHEEQQYKEQFFFVRMESVTTERKKSQADPHLLLRRRSSVRGFKELSFNEFSFKNSMESSQDHGRDNNTPPSSRQNVETPTHLNSNDALRRLGDSNLSFSAAGGGGGLKRTMTPSFTNRPSGFFKQNSMRSLVGARNGNNFLIQTQPVSSIGSIIPHDLKSDRGFPDLHSPGLHPSIEGSIHFNELLDNVKNDSKTMTLNPFPTAQFVTDSSKRSFSEDPSGNSNIMLSNRADEKSLSRAGSPSSPEKRITNGSLASAIRQSQFNKQMENPYSGYGIRHSSTLPVNVENLEPQMDEINIGRLKHHHSQQYSLQPVIHQHSSNPVPEPMNTSLAVNMKGSEVGSINSFATGTDTSTPQKILISKESLRNSRPEHNVAHAEEVPKSCNPPGSAESLNFIPLTPQGQEKVQNPPSLINIAVINIKSRPSSPKICPSDPASTTSIPRSGRSYSSMKNNNNGPNSAATLNTPTPKQAKSFFNIPKLSVNEKFKRNLLEVVKSEADDISPILSPVKITVNPRRPSMISAEIELQAVDKEPNSGSKLANPKSMASSQQGVRRVSKNLLILAREGSDNNFASQRNSPIGLPMDRIRKMGSVEIFDSQGTSPSPINQDLNVRNNLYDQESYRNNGPFNGAGGHIQNSPNYLASNQNINHNIYTDTSMYADKTIYNPEDNITATNISKYAFAYDYEEVEYDEGREINSHSMMSSPDHRILTGIMNSPSHNTSQVWSPQHGHSKFRQPEDTRRESIWGAGRSNLLNMNSIKRRDSMNSTKSNGLVSRKDSMNSTISNHVFTRMDTNEILKENGLRGDSPVANSPQNQAPRESIEPAYEEPVLKDQAVPSPSNSKATPIVGNNSRNYKSIRNSIFQQVSGVGDSPIESRAESIHELKMESNVTSTIESKVESRSEIRNEMNPDNNPSKLTRIVRNELKAKSMILASPFAQGAQEANSNIEQSQIGQYELGSNNHILPAPELTQNTRNPPMFMHNRAADKNLLTPPVRSQHEIGARKKSFGKVQTEGTRPIEDSKSFDGSKSPNIKGHFLKRMQTTVVETNKLDKTKDDEGQKKINHYLLIKDLGKGGFGKVKLAQDTGTNQYYAVKIANKTKLKRKLLSKTNSAFTTLQREVAIMKKLEHPNIVKLYEVINDPNEDKLYLVMDLIKKGAVMSRAYWKLENKEALDRSGLSFISNPDISLISEANTRKVLSEEKSLKYFRDLMLGLDYLHNHAGVIHRDIKPENLLIDEFDTLKVSDFGVSHIMEDNSDELKNNAGTKYFLPPESFEGKSFKGKPADIWAAGATLFYFLTGKAPFQATNQSDLMAKVMNDEPDYPETMNKEVVDVIKACLKKNPEERATLQDLMTSSWLTEGGQFTVQNVYEDESEFAPSEQEINAAFSKLTFRATVLIKAKMKKHLNKTRDNIEQRRKTIIMPDDMNKSSSPQKRLNKSDIASPADIKKLNQQRKNLLKVL